MSLSWIPNAITLFRIVLIMPILLLILAGSFGWAMSLFLLAGFSDGVDGYLAKRYDWGSRIGALLDPIADKLLVVGMFATLAYLQHIPLWLAALVILRDVVIISGATAYNFLVRPVEGEPTRVSKLNTALQLLFLMVVISRAGFGWPDEISVTVLGASILITVVISGVDYVWSWSQRARKGE
jgi:cardiolipin synthase